MKNWQIVLTTVLIGLIAARARAVPPGWPVDTYWQVDTGDWSNGANWNNGEPTGTNYDKAYINNSGTAHITQVGEDCQYLTLGENAGQSGSVELSGAGQLSATWEYIGKGGTGTFIHTGGTNSTRSVYIGTYGASGHGTYELSGDGQLLTTYEHIGWGLNGTGTFTQTGGINSADAVMHLGASAGSNGTYELSGTGQLSVLRQNIGNCGTGSFIQTGGTHTVNMWLSVARWASGHGTYELSGDGQLSAPNEYIGEESTGSFTQTGGTNTVSGSVYLGLDVGSDGIYTISDGSLNTANLYTGYNGNGILTVVGDDSTVSVSNNYTQGSNGTLETKFDTDGISAISVGGSAILDGTWNVVDLGGAPFGTFDILLAGGGISGTFGTVNLPGPDWSWGISASSSDTLWVQHIPEPTTVDVDIKPGSWPNPFNSRSEGVLPVAVLGTDDFDVMTIDPATILLGLEGFDDSVSPLRWDYEDVGTPYEGEPSGGHDLGADGFLDLSLKFDIQALLDAFGLSDAQGESLLLSLSGNLTEENDGSPIQGSDWIRLLHPGDANADGFVNASDLTLVISNWGQSVPSGERGDLNGNGVVDGSDYTEVLSYWGTGTPPEPTATPEPATLGLLLFGGLIALRRRSKYFLIA